MTFTVVATMKNEAPFLLEWIAHHQVIGFDEIVVCWNDCEDGTDTMLHRMVELGLAHQHPTVIRKGGIQRSALRQVRNLEPVQKADWIYVCDADEFLNIHVGDNTVQALVQQSTGADPDIISVPWRIFGSGGKEFFEDRPVTEKFRYCERRHHPRRNRQAGQQVKSLFTRQDRFRRFGLHTPVAWEEDADKVVQVYPGGELAAENPPSFRHAQVNHYIVRSMDSYLVKRDRGRANHMNHVLGLDYWEKWNRNATTDASIDRYDAAKAEAVAALRADKLLDELHEAAVAWHRDKIAEMRAREDVAEIIPRLQETLFGPDGPPAAATETEDAA